MRCYRDNEIEFLSNEFLSLGGQDCRFRGSPNSVKELARLELDVYPNPVYESLTIELPNWDELVPVRLVNVFGQEVKRIKFHKKMEIPVEDLASGAWFLLLEGGEGLIAVHKMTKL